MNRVHDVAIVGGGMVGAALALALTRSGMSVALVDRQPVSPPTARDEYDLRVSALSPASERLLNALGVWFEIEAVRASPYRRMEVWDAVGKGSLTFQAAEAGEPALGHIVENRLVQGVLRNTLGRQSRALVLCPAQVEEFELGGDSAVVHLDDGTRVEARLLVGADGANSAVREAAGIQCHDWNYRQRALVTHLGTREHHGASCFQRFLPEGPLAFLPLKDGRSSIVWSATPERTRELEAMSDDDFAEEVASAIEHRLGRVSRVGPRASFPLRYLHAKRYAGERVALVGDAAHVVHPLAGQGVNLGFLDAAALAQVLVESKRAGRDFGRVSELRPYERWRRADNTVMANALHGLKYLFGTGNEAVAWTRSLGLNLVDELKPVKRLFMRQAAGMTGELPNLAKGELP